MQPKWSLCLLSFLFFFVACRDKPEQARRQQTQELDIGWSFKARDSLSWMPAKVPGAVFTNLHINGHLPEAATSKAAQQMRWLASKEWGYSYKLQLDTALMAYNYHTLRLKGLPKGTKIKLDGQTLSTSHSILQILEVPLDQYLKQGEQLLQLVIPIQKSAFLPYMEGSRYLPKLPGAGLYASPKLIHWEGCRVVHSTFESSAQNTKYQLQLNGRKETKVQVRLSVLSVGQQLKEQKREIELKKGKQQLEFEFASADLPEWNPFGRGYQEQLDWALQVVMDSQTVYQDTLYRGLCQWELRKGIWRHPKKKPLPLRMAVWKPISPDYTQAEDSNYFNRLYALRSAGYNTLLVDQGHWLEQEQFYEMCSRYGLMVLHHWPDEQPDSLVKAHFNHLNKYTCFQGLVADKEKKANFPVHVLEEKQMQHLPPQLEFDANAYGSGQVLSKQHLIKEYGLEESAIMRTMQQYQNDYSLERNAYLFEVNAAQQLRKDFSRGKNLVAATKPFPSLSGALTNYSGQPTAALYESSRFHQTLFAQAHRDGQQVSIAIGNNSGSSLRDYRVRISRFPTNKTYAPKVIYENQMVLAEGITKVTEFSINEEEDSLSFGVLVEVEDDQDSLQLTQPLYLSDWQKLKLSANPPLYPFWEYKGFKGYLHLQSNVLVKNVRLSHPNPEFYFEDNYFDLVPGHPKTLVFLLPEPYLFSELKSGLQITYLNPSIQ